VRIAGREDIAMVSLKEVRNARVTMKLPVNKMNVHFGENQFPGCFLSWAILTPRMLRMVDHSIGLCPPGQ
jgi:hypothetical protein